MHYMTRPTSSLNLELCQNVKHSILTSVKKEMLLNRNCQKRLEFWLLVGFKSADVYVTVQLYWKNDESTDLPPETSLTLM